MDWQFLAVNLVVVSLGINNTVHIFSSAKKKPADFADFDPFFECCENSQLSRK